MALSKPIGWIRTWEKDRGGLRKTEEVREGHRPERDGGCRRGTEEA